MNKDRRYRTLPMKAQWSWQRGPGTETTAALRLTDEESGIALAEVTFTAEQLMQLMSSLVIDVNVSVPAPTVMARMGKRMERERIDHPETLMKGYYQSEPSDAMRAFAAERKEAEGWDTVAWTKHNFGWALTGTRWVDAPATDA